MKRATLKRLAAALLPGLTLVSAPAASQADGYVTLGATSEGTPAISLGLDRTFSLSRWHPQLALRLGSGLLLLPGDDRDDNAAWTLTPALRWTFAGERGVFAEAGIGAAVFLNTRHEDRHLSTAFQFEDRLALGLPLGSGELSASLIHYSNAGLKRPNEGFETLSLGYRFPL
ncbi:lipid A 3-O-deacylase [Franzmannia pantelleriensis]|uniref:Lipid A 3-O-deacylase n=1 Tax=Franzmannia pantelleriensis TaxID=48727 RepID=A0A1G9L260_9GAMM|nr:acyloxyacyl hydrolase [Halomonas pantelleriensis]SDL55787.1 lipid A 3-O-deacylase [Halomonas pantelleriensis]